MNILLVDDDEIIRMGMKKMIMGADKGWEVVAEAGDGEIALQKLKEFTDIHLIITDVRMPIMDGIQLIRNVRETNKTVRIIVLSGYDDFEYVRGAFMHGAVDYLLKPFHKKDLLERIEIIENDILSAEKEEHYHSKSRQAMMADTMSHLFRGEKIAESMQELETMGVRTQFPCYLVLAIQADQYYRQYQDVQQYEKRLREDLDTILAHFSKREDFDYCYSLNRQKLILICFYHGEEDERKFSKRIFDVLQGGRTELDTDSMGVSNVHSDIAEIGSAYQEAMDAVQARFYLGQNRQIFYREIELKCIDMQYDLDPAVSQLVHYLELCDYIKAKKELEQIFLDLSYCKPGKFRDYMRRMMEMLGIRIKDFKNILLLCAPDYQYKIEYINTYRELKTFMSSILQGTVKYIESERKKKSQKRIELAKTFIGENYHKPITLNDVADYVELNASYFSNLFKEEAGINFTDYLMNVRMENAKKLLRNPKIKIYEVGIMVGYEDAVSFGRAFKKRFGLSPKEYRNSVY